MDHVAQWLDYPLGWLLDVPRDLALAIVSLGTAALMTIARKLVTNQDLLRRSSTDLKTLRSRLRRAKEQQDHAEVDGIKNIVAIIKMTELRADLRVLLWVIVPVGLLAIWAAARLDYLPIKSGDVLTLRAIHPLSSQHKPATLVPHAGITLESPAIALVNIVNGEPPSAESRWRIRFAAESGEIPLTIRHMGVTAVHPITLGRSPGVVRIDHGGSTIIATEIDLKRFRFLGIIPGIDAIGFPPWLVAYLLMTVPLATLLRRLAGVF